MQGITVSGGRLNLYSLLQDYEDQCVACPAPLTLTTGRCYFQSAVLKWTELPAPHPSASGIAAWVYRLDSAEHGGKSIFARRIERMYDL